MVEEVCLVVNQRPFIPLLPTSNTAKQRPRVLYILALCQTSLVGPLKEAGANQSLEHSHAKQKHISKVNIGLSCCPRAARKSRIKEALVAFRNLRRPKESPQMEATLMKCSQRSALPSPQGGCYPLHSCFNFRPFSVGG